MRRKLNAKKLVIFILFILTIIIFLIFLINYIIKLCSFEYKLSKIGYNDKEIEILSKKVNRSERQTILNNKYNEKIPLLYNERYFIFDNLNKYLEHYIRNREAKYVVSVINTNSYLDYYESTFETDINKKDLMLVNKYNYLKDNYVPENLIKVDSKYAYDGVYIKDYVFEEAKQMIEDAKVLGYNLILFSGYRSYEDQAKAYASVKADYGERKADEIAAKGGYSEHQTGLAIEIGVIDKTFEGSDEQSWLKENSYKYGFILRYPSSKEYITGFNYEPCHYRYVGREKAKKIYEESITFDEYYAYYEE